MNGKWKRFWSLTKHGKGGFTLVELIVVIAILAVLAGVGVPAYSGYVKKANMQADMTLISEIEHALTLAYYNQDLAEGESGYVVLMPNVPVSDVTPNILTPLEKTFGSNWASALQLKYDGWGVSWTTMSYDAAKNYVDSNFAQKYSANELMSHVQAMTDAVNGLSLEIGDTQIQLYDMYGYKDADGNHQNTIIDTMKKYGIGDSEEDWKALSSEKKSNVLVLATASGIEAGQQSSAANLIPRYALYTAYAAENAEFNEAYKTFQNTIKNVNPDSADSEYEQLKKAYNDLEAAAGTGFDNWRNAATGETDAEGNAITVGDSHTNAFKSAMAAVGSAMNENGEEILAQLDDSNMFTTGIGYDMYNDYLGTAYAVAQDPYSGTLAGLMDMLDEDYAGGAIVWYSVVNGNLYIGNSIPTV